MTTRAFPTGPMPRPDFPHPMRIRPVLARLGDGTRALFMAACDPSGRPLGASGTLAWNAPVSVPPPAGALDRAAFTRIVLPHLDAAYNLARFLARDADAADDIVQDAFLRAFRAFGGFRGGDARAWLLAIVRNCARGWANERARAGADARAVSTPVPSEDGAETEGPSPGIPTRTRPRPRSCARARQA